MASIHQPDGQDVANNNALAAQDTLYNDIDYKQLVETLLIHVAKAIMCHLGAYAILATDATFGSHREVDLPSQVPDFRGTVVCSVPKSRHLHLQHPMFWFYV